MFVTPTFILEPKKIHAEIVAIDASENKIFLHILMMPCFRQYQNVLILIAVHLPFRRNKHTRKLSRAAAAAP